jgi:hypothetical protein
MKCVRACRPEWSVKFVCRANIDARSTVLTFGPQGAEATGTGARVTLTKRGFDVQNSTLSRADSAGPGMLRYFSSVAVALAS